MEEQNMQFMQIAMKYLPEAKQILDETGVELSMEHVQPVLTLLTKVMKDAYELGKQDALAENENN
ncbi:competence protein ComG [Priestia megaterium]|jgi:competence protein ComZ|uniref:ComZ family protein n=1 Tax=Priestia megaterium (strain ATCC 14581 / DSM 32 / CCUG 1817 / JCM 2506 / NBRC 15308 / NCIMB 9376 / NCTC 10342 / NRRL B-14308 / VKM B-512 / Ford 19) TaxID=1348623 RepID=A0A0B6AKV7_PRIM2|nr:ComZ family protein [Priestia megaterium]AJI25510.1 comZ family protein [Priestia megaterium NBRC 15308 = ATCC 14581]KFM96518.1 comZ family protein [Priestia megaterium]KGJ76389.1 competence protein ComG [Priestia megaterium NBRC 15308 = ATCC 14581]MDR4232485.1 competence protein ComG [Priestia megaterium]MED3805874.1 ComZ family protein [Priestia megaterium]